MTGALRKRQLITAGAAPTIGRGPPDKEPKGQGDGGQIYGFAQKDRYSRASGEDARFAGANGETFPTARELLDMYDAIGIEAGVMLPYINVECAYDTVTNREIAEMAAAHSGRLHWFCNIDPRQGGNAPDTDFSDFLTYYRALGACGVGEICGSLPLDDPRMLNLLKHCERCGLPVIFHFGGASGDYGVVDEFGLPRLEYVLARFPALKVLGHSQRFWSLISGDAPVDVWNGYPKGRVAAGGRVVELMRRYGNLCGDLSAGSGYNALSRDPEFA